MFNRKPLLEIKVKAFISGTIEVAEQIHAFSYGINQRLINEGYNIDTDTLCNIKSFVLDIGSPNLSITFFTKDNKEYTLNNFEDIEDNSPEKIFIASFKEESDLLFDDLLKHGYQRYFEDNIYKSDKITFYHDKATLDSNYLLQDNFNLEIDIDKYSYNETLDNLLYRR